MDTALDTGPLLGTWLNYYDQTTGILRIVLSERRGIPMIRATGARRPEPVDWGEAFCAVYTDGATGRRATALSAHYRFPALTVMLAGYLNKRLLVVDAYTKFTDGTGRSDYFQRDHFYLDPARTPTGRDDRHAGWADPDVVSG
jgi:hypothetical protein